jgi:hypothetical protein
MQSEKINAMDVTGVGVARNSGLDESIGATGVYAVECIGADGQVKWTDTFNNLVTTAGKNDLLDKYMAGSAYTAAWYLGLVDGASTPTYAAGDTSASHAGWSESAAYSNSTRPAVSWSSASSGSKASSATAFNINGTATIAGAFLISNSTKSGSTGILYSAGSFTGGNRSVASGDTLNVTYTASV